MKGFEGIEIRGCLVLVEREEGRERRRNSDIVRVLREGIEVRDIVKLCMLCLRIRGRVEVEDKGSEMEDYGVK